MIDFRHILAAAAISLPGILGAVSADPRPRQVMNPDGSIVTVRVHGNEFFNFMTDEDCSRILTRDARGFVADMVRDGAPVMFTKENVQMLSAKALEAFPAVAAQNVSSMQKMASLDYEGRSNYPTIGQGNRSLVVLVEFQDVEFTIENPKEYFTRQLNERGFSDYGGYGSALDYYIDASNGLYIPRFDVVGPVKVSKDASYFKDMGSSNMKTLIKESLTELHEAGEVDFSEYDLDEDGVVDTVFFYYAGYGSADSDTETIWPHQYDYRYLTGFGGGSLRFDGKTVGPYACANELKGYNPETRKQPWLDGSEPWMDGIGTFVHEYGHVLGLPDLYDVEYSGEAVTPGEWDVMDQGSYNFNGCRPPIMSAYEQWVCRWLDYTEAENEASYDLKALANTETPTAVRIRIPKNDAASSFQSEYFVIEARDNSKWDSCFPNPGLMVWRINYSKNKWISNAVNSKDGSNVEIVYAKNKKTPLFEEGAIYPGGPVELVPSKQYDFWESPIITSISYDVENQTGHFEYNMFNEAPTGAPVLHDDPYADESGARNFTIEWDPVDGADSYQVTIKRVSTGKVLGIYDERNVGDVTSLTVLSVPVSFWNNEIEAYVRAVKIIPCSDISNVVRFVPKSLPLGKDAAVDGVEDDASVISGGAGCVMAPEGAEVFDMAGKRLSKDGLAPGVYIVVYGAVSRKVVVR